MPIVKKLSSLVSIKRKTPTDRLPTGYLGNNAVATAMIRDLSVTPGKLSFPVPTLLVNMPFAVSVTEGQAVYWNGTAFDLAIASSLPSSKFVGFAVKDETLAVKNIIVSGIAQNVFTGLTPGATYYLSQTVAGAITTTIPSGGLVVKVGKAISANQLLVEVEEIGIYDAGTGPTTINFYNGSVQTLTQTAAITAFTNAVPGKWYTLIITSNGSAYSLPVTWATGSAPPASGAGAVKVVLVLCQTSTSFIAFSLDRDRTTELVSANFLGSVDVDLDKSSAGRGIFLRRPDGTLRELTIDNNDQIAVYSI